MLGLLEGYAETTWDVGIRFGTVGARIDGRSVEITTYRAEQYDPESRKPDVVYGASLEDDLGRRDFTINAMALRLPEQSFVDLYGGLEDLAAGLIRTPGTPEQSFSDDPLRMLRAARFSAQLGFGVADDVVAAMAEQGERLSIVSAERIREEFLKIVMSPDPRRGRRPLRREQPGGRRRPPLLARPGSPLAEGGRAVRPRSFATLSRWSARARSAGSAKTPIVRTLGNVS